MVCNCFRSSLPRFAWDAILRSRAIKYLNCYNRAVCCRFSLRILTGRGLSRSWLISPAQYPHPLQPHCHLAGLHNPMLVPSQLVKQAFSVIGFGEGGKPAMHFCPSKVLHILQAHLSILQAHLSQSRQTAPLHQSLCCFYTALGHLSPTGGTT